MARIVALLSVLVSSPAFASAPTVPEMDAGAGVAAIALLVGVVAVMREKRRK